MHLTRQQIDRSLRLSLWEGVAWASMVGLGETYFVADAVRLGASPLELALTVTLPLATGGLGPLLGLTILRLRRRRKPVAVTAALLQALVLVTLALVELAGRSTPRLLILLVCLYQTTGQAAGTSWSSWYSDLVPQAVRGRYFARRNRGIHAATLLGLVVAGLVLYGLEPASASEVTARAGGSGFALLFSLAVLCRLVSVSLLLAAPEPAFRGVAGRAQASRFLRSARGTHAMRWIGLGVFFHFTVYVGSPYFGPYMLETLRFTYLEFMAASLWVVACKLLGASIWGPAVDRRGSRRIVRLAFLLVAVVPLPWLAARGLVMVLAAQTLSGLSWSAYELSYFTVLLESSTRATRPALFVAQSLLGGWAQLGGSVFGAWLLPTVGADYRALFGVSASMRLLIALAVPWVMAPMATLQTVRAQWLAMRTLGIRPGGGLTRRPVYDPVEPTEADDVDACNLSEPKRV